MDGSVDELQAEAFNPDGGSITTDGRESDGESGDQEEGYPEIIASTAHRAVGEQAKSADKRTCGGAELPGCDSSAADNPSPEVSPNYDFNECLQQLTDIDMKENNEGHVVGHRSKFLKEQKLDESLAHYWQLA